MFESGKQYWPNYFEIIGDSFQIMESCIKIITIDEKGLKTIRIDQISSTIYICGMLPIKNNYKTMQKVGLKLELKVW